MTTRIDIRKYYRKSIGFMSAINALWLLCISGLAIYISEFGELSPETNSQISEFLLYGFYATFFVGAFMFFMLLIGGMVALKTNSEGVFKFLMIISVVTMLLSAVFTYSSAYSLWWAGITWRDKYEMGVLCIGLVLGILTLAYSIFIIVMAFCGRRYYDTDKKAAREATDIQLKRLDIKYAGYNMISYVLLAVSVYALALYFKNDIAEFDKVQAVDNAKFITLFGAVFISGVIVSVIHAAITILIFVRGTNQIMRANKIVLAVQNAVTVFYIIMTIISMGQDFTKRGYADPSYMIFSYILIAVNLIISIRTFKMKVSE